MKKSRKNKKRERDGKTEGNKLEDQATKSNIPIGVIENRETRWK